MSELPEQKARRDIDADLAAAGWLVQDRDDLDLTAGRGIAVREFPMMSGFGFADYLLYVDRQAIGAIEAKATGTLSGVEAQSAKSAGLPESLPAPDILATEIADDLEAALEQFQKIAARLRHSTAGRPL